MIPRRTLVAAAFFLSLAGPALADADAPIAPAAGLPAVGEWIGHVSWNAPIVTYAWAINADGTFTSGRAGRGHGGGGAWGARGARVTLKYDNSFRYEGEVHGDTYSGTAYRTDGRALGAFAMWRATKAARELGG